MSLAVSGLVETLTPDGHLFRTYAQAAYYVDVFMDMVDKHDVVLEYANRLKRRPKDIVAMGKFVCFTNVSFELHPRL